MNALTPPVAADTVAPLAGAWVEINLIEEDVGIGDSRSPRGSVG